MTTASSAAPENAPALEITRVFRAPRERVFAAWTDPAQVDWWGPEGCETLRYDADNRVGGNWRWTLRTPGGDMSARGTFRQLHPDTKLVNTWQWEDDPDWEGVESVITVDFRDHAEGTELHLTHTGFPNAGSCDNHIGGWNSALDKLERQLADHSTEKTN